MRGYLALLKMAAAQLPGEQSNGSCGQNESRNASEGDQELEDEVLEEGNVLFFLHRGCI